MTYLGAVTNIQQTIYKVSKGAEIRNRYNQVPHLTQDTNWKVTNSQLDTTNESQEVSLFVVAPRLCGCFVFGSVL